jgi:hypothetical protein
MLHVLSEHCGVARRVGGRGNSVQRGQQQCAEASAIT